jgi:hypothetical protein
MLELMEEDQISIHFEQLKAVHTDTLALLSFENKGRLPALGMCA